MSVLLMFVAYFGVGLLFAVAIGAIAEGSDNAAPVAVMFFMLWPLLIATGLVAGVIVGAVSLGAWLRARLA